MGAGLGSVKDTCFLASTVGHRWVSCTRYRFKSKSMHQSGCIEDAFWIYREFRKYTILRKRRPWFRGYTFLQSCYEKVGRIQLLHEPTAERWMNQGNLYSSSRKCALSDLMFRTSPLLRVHLWEDQNGSLAPFSSRQLHASDLRLFEGSFLFFKSGAEKRRRDRKHSRVVHNAISSPKLFIFV